MPTALITGAARGIGRCLCEGFAALGYDVLACDTDEARFSHPNILPVRMDLREEASIEAAFALAR